MRGSQGRSGALVSDVDLEARVPADHPLRRVRHLADAVPGDLSPLFAELYAPVSMWTTRPRRLSEP